MDWVLISSLVSELCFFFFFYVATWKPFLLFFHHPSLPSLISSSFSSFFIILLLLLVQVALRDLVINRTNLLICMGAWVNSIWMLQGPPDSCLSKLFFFKFNAYLLYRCLVIPGDTALSLPTLYPAQPCLLFFFFLLLVISHQAILKKKIILRLISCVEQEDSSPDHQAVLWINHWNPFLIDDLLLSS